MVLSLQSEYFLLRFLLNSPNHCMITLVEIASMGQCGAGMNRCGLGERTEGHFCSYLEEGFLRIESVLQRKDPARRLQ